MSAEPRATPVARYVAVLIGSALLSLAVVCGRELWLRNAEDSDWESWVDPVVMTVGDATFQPWMLPAAVVAVLVALVLVWISVRPRTRTHRRVASSAGVWMRPVDIARMLTATARTVPGVSSAHSQVTGASATVTVATHSGRDDVAESVPASLAPLIDELGLDLTLRVNTGEVSR